MSLNNLIRIIFIFNIKFYIFSSLSHGSLSLSLSLSLSGKLVSLLIILYIMFQFSQSWLTQNNRGMRIRPDELGEWESWGLHVVIGPCIIQYNLATFQCYYDLRSMPFRSQSSRRTLENPHDPTIVMMPS